MCLTLQSMDILNEIYPAYVVHNLFNVRDIVLRPITKYIVQKHVMIFVFELFSLNTFGVISIAFVSICSK